MTILSHLLVVDASWGLSGPVASWFLADAGAQVVKVEPPGGDPIRWAPGFATWNRNKRSVVLDFHDEAERARLHELLAMADVFIHGLTPRRAAAMGLDDEMLRRRYPTLIVSAVTGYPGRHPDAERPGHDILVQARTGLMDEQITDRPGPALSRIPLPSWGAAYLAAIGILARLHTRQRTGQGGPAHTSLLQGALTCLSTIWIDAEHPSERMAQKLPLPKRATPHTFECADGTWIQVNAFYPTVALITESLLELGIDIPPEDMDPVDKAEVYRPVFRQRTAEEWLVACWSTDVSAQPVQRFGDLLRDKQALSNGYLTEVDDPTWGRIRQPGTLWTAPWASAAPTPAPGLGQHEAGRLVSDLKQSEETHPSAREVESSAIGSVSASGAPSLARADVAGYDPTARAPKYPLEGLKVLDFGSFVGGPYGPTLLAQLGADVIKVEPRTGDRMRLDDLIFVGTQSGKRAITLDLKARGARKVLTRLIEWADVVHHNVRAGSLAGLGLDYQSVRAINPSVVYCHVSGFGPEGTLRMLPVFDPEMQALCGWFRANTPPDKVPSMVRSAPTDVHGALLSLVPTLLALLRRNSGGQGAHLETSILAAMTLVTSETTLRTDADVLVSIAQIDDDGRGLAPSYRIYDTADGTVAVAAMTERRQVALLGAVRAEHHDALEASFKGLAMNEALAALADAGVPAESVRVNHEGAFLNDPENLECGIAVRHHHAIYGEVAQIGALWDFGDLATKLDRPAPTLGQHSREVLMQLGVSDAEIRLLAAQGLVIGDAML